MKSIAKKSYSEFRKMIPNKFIVTRGPQKGARVSDFRTTVGQQIRLFRSVHGRKMDHRLDRDERWPAWLAEVEFDETTWEKIKKISGDDVDGLADRQSNIEYYIAIYYRLHAFLDDTTFADEIDRLVFSQPLRDIGEHVFDASNFRDTSIGPASKIKNRMALVEERQEIMISDNAQMKEQIAALTAIFRLHLKVTTDSLDAFEGAFQEAERHIGRSDGAAADRIFLDTISQILSHKIEPEYDRIAKLHIERARSFLLFRKPKNAVSAYFDALALPCLNEETRLYCELCSFVAVSFSGLYEGAGLRFPARKFVFDDDQRGFLPSLVKFLKADGVDGPLIPRMNKAVREYYDGENYRSWTALSEDAGLRLMQAAQALDETTLADIALLGFEYMAMSYHAADDPIDVEETIKNRLRAIYFINGIKQPTESQMQVSNIYRFI